MEKKLVFFILSIPLLEGLGTMRVNFLNIFSFFLFTPPQNRGGAIFSLQLSVCLCVCLSVCVSVCPALLVDKIPAEWMHRFGRDFR